MAVAAVTLCSKWESQSQLHSEHAAPDDVGNDGVHPLIELLDQVKAALAGALYPNVAVMDEAAKTGRPAWNDGIAEVALHPASMLHPLEAPRFNRPFLVYLEKASCFSLASTATPQRAGCIGPCCTRRMRRAPAAHSSRASNSMEISVSHHQRAGCLVRFAVWRCRA